MAAGSVMMPSPSHGLFSALSPYDVASRQPFLWKFSFFSSFQLQPRDATGSYQVQHCAKLVTGAVVPLKCCNGMESCLIKSMLSGRCEGAVSVSLCKRTQRGDGYFRNRRLLSKIQAVHDHGASVQRNDAAISGPLIKPSPELSAEEAVEEQLKALSTNDEPRADHGLEVLYYFANASGTFEGNSLPRYFGFAADLYHFGHFALKFKTRYPSLIDLSGYEIIQTKMSDASLPLPLQSSIPRSTVLVKTIDVGGAECFWEFQLSKVPRGVLDPCWLTDSLLPFLNGGATI